MHNIGIVVRQFMRSVFSVHGPNAQNFVRTLATGSAEPRNVQACCWIESTESALMELFCDMFLGDPPARGACHGTDGAVRRIRQDSNAISRILLWCFHNFWNVHD